MNAAAVVVSPVQRFVANLGKQVADDALRLGRGRTVVGRFLWSDMTSVFQPVVAARTGAAVAAQALARLDSADGAAVSPWSLFAMAATDDDLVQLDRRCR